MAIVVTVNRLIVSELMVVGRIILDHVIRQIGNGFLIANEVIALFFRNFTGSVLIIFSKVSNQAIDYSFGFICLVIRLLQFGFCDVRTIQSQVKFRLNLAS